MPGTDDKQALILVDIQNDYFPAGSSPLIGADAAAKAACHMLDRAREKLEFIIHVQHVSLRPAASFFLPNTPGVEIHSSVTPWPNEVVIQKHYPNSFRETALLEVLRHRNISRLCFCGMMTHMCIDTTVRAAVDLGFKCSVVADATATKDLTYREVTATAAAVQAAYLAALDGLFAEVI
jgi:nicotinamidase-related amidase